MKLVAPLGPVYQAGTLSGNPVAMAAGYAQLTLLKSNPSFYKQLTEKGEKLYGGMEEILKKNSVKATINYIGSLGSVFFTEKKVENYEDAKTSDTAAFADYFRFMLEQGIHLAPSQFEAMFLSVAHTDAEIQRTLDSFSSYFGG